ncbi:MAG: restriction endonuclease [Chloroflexi bacterium]|nr:restriction endonuclease [Chloroflexota bacterium]
MTVPAYQTVMLPVLEETADGAAHPVSEFVGRIEERFELSPDDRAQMLPSGTQRTIVNRVHWAVSYMVQAGLLSRVGRGLVVLTDRGRMVLKEGRDHIDVKYLERFPEFLEFRARSGSRSKVATGTLEDSQATPEETLGSTYESVRTAVEASLLERVLASPPAFFEQLVVDLLVAMGYGGANTGEVGRRVGRSGDDGIDGVIDEDRLGLDAVYVQAKRWATDRPVRRPDLQAFAGSLEGRRAGKGVFISTSRFTADAADYVTRISRRISLIDGAMLARLMYDHGIGVRSVNTYEVKRVDTGYFEEEG